MEKYRKRWKKKEEFIDFKNRITNRSFEYLFKNSFEVSKSVYGMNKQYRISTIYRYESLLNKSFIERKNLRISLRLFRSFLPVNRDFRYRAYAILYYFTYLRIYRALRHLSNLPAHGQRTWSNANTVKRVDSMLRRVFAQKCSNKYPFLTRTYSMTAGLANYANLLWFENWRAEWEIAEKQRTALQKKGSIAKVDLYAMSRFFIKIETGGYKVSKKTKQKRKIERILNYTTGLPLNFVYQFLRRSAKELRRMNLQFLYTKTSRVIIPKKQKQSKRKKQKQKLGKGVKTVAQARKLQKKKKKSIWD